MALLGDKRLRNSATMIGAAIFGLIQTAEALGEVPPGVAANLAIIGKALAALYGVFGFRRAIGQNGLNAPLDPSDEIDAT